MEPVKLWACAGRIGGLALVALALVPVAALASGGDSIANAPALPYGTLVSGGGQPQKQYYRLPMFGGDRLTLDVDKPQAGRCQADLNLSLFQPGVTDYQIANTQPIDTTGTIPEGKQEFVWTSPFTGPGILQVAGCEEVGSASFTLIATTAHRTAVVVRAPSLARRRSLVTVSATVQSPAGEPQGSCLIGGNPAPVAGGHCAGRLRLGRGKRQTVRVEFVPDDGWLGSSGSRTIRFYR